MGPDDRQRGAAFQPTSSAPVAKAPTLEEAVRLIGVAQHEPWPQLLALALVSGLRRGELLGLRWCDVDLDQGWLEVAQVVEQGVGRDFVIRALPKTKTSARRIGLDQDAVRC